MSEGIFVTLPDQVQVTYKGRVFNVLDEGMGGRDPEVLDALAGSGYPDIGTTIPTPEPSDQGEKSEPVVRPKHICPGFDGEPYSATCGTFEKALVCPEGPTHFYKVIPHFCKKPGCPICKGAWAARATDRALSLIMGLILALKVTFRPRHVVFSPPGITHPEDPVQACRDVLEAFGKVVDHVFLSGLQALALVVHPYRFRKGMREEARREMKAEAFKGNPYEYVLSRRDWGRYLYLSPHIHAITLGAFIPSDQFERETGWIYRNLGIRKSVPGTIYYLLTHTWVKDNPKALRYWKAFSTRNLGCTKTVEEVTKKCPVCQEEVRVVGRDEDFQDLHNAPRYWARVEIRTYWVRYHGPDRPGQHLLGGPLGPPGGLHAP